MCGYRHQETAAAVTTMNQQLSVTALNDAALGLQFKSEWFWLTNRHDCIQNGRPTNRHKIAAASWRQKEKKL